MNTTLDAAVRRGLQRHLDDVSASSAGPLRVVRCRVRLTGRTPLHGRIEETLEGLGELEITDAAGLRLIADPRPLVDTRPALDLHALARGRDAPALLARLLLSLEPAGEAQDAEVDLDLDRLFRLASRSATGVVSRSHYASGGLPELDAAPGSPRLVDGIRRQAARLLDSLMAQREGS